MAMMKWSLAPARPVPKPSANSSNVFDFLTENDRQELGFAYEFAVDNQLSLEDVELLAGLLSIDRRRETAEAAGIQYIFHTLSVLLDRAC